MVRWHTLILAACIAAPLALAQDVKRQSQSASANASAQQNDAVPASAFPASTALAIQRSLESIATAQVAQANAGKSADDSKREKQDLEAQQDMAYWAKAMFFATLLSAAVSAGATWLLFLTLKQSRLATFAALRAAVANRQAVRVARENAEKELRAYLNVFEIIAEWKNDEDLAQHRIWVSIQIKNVGQTPAHNVRSWMGYVSSKTEPVEFGEIEAKSPAVCSPGQSLWMSDEVTLIGEDKVLNWKRGKETFYVWGKIVYVDVFDEPRETSFRYVMPLSGIGADSGRFRPCEQGNKAT